MAYSSLYRIRPASGSKCIGHSRKLKTNGRRYRIKIILCAVALFLSKSLSAHGLFSNINSSYCYTLPCTRRCGTPRRCWMSCTLSEHNSPAATRRRERPRDRQIALALERLAAWRMKERPRLVTPQLPLIALHLRPPPEVLKQRRQRRELPSDRRPRQRTTFQPLPP